MEVAKLLYNSGFSTIVIASRSSKKCLDSIVEIQNQNKSSTSVLDWHELDTSDLDSVKNFSNWFKAKYTSLNLLINNAGIHYITAAVAEESRRSKQGYDLSFATNYFGHFYLTELLLPVMKWGRIINVASTYHFLASARSVAVGDDNAPPPFSVVGSDYEQAYPTSKLAQILFSKELQRRLSSRGFVCIVLYSNLG